MGEGYRATDTMRRLFGCVIMATLMLACSSPPERPRKVGRVERSYADASRPNWTGDGSRPLLSMIWFPTDSDSTEERWPVGNRFLPLFWAGWSIPDAELSKRESRYPLVVLSHGTGGATAQVSWLAESLASHGYIVAAVNHHGNNAIDEETPHGFFLWWERADDLRVLIDRVLEDPMFDDRVDRLRIGAAGFSLADTPSLRWRVQERTWTRWSASAMGETRIPVASCRRRLRSRWKPWCSISKRILDSANPWIGIAFRTPIHGYGRSLRWRRPRGCPSRRSA